MEKKSVVEATSTSDRGEQRTRLQIEFSPAAQKTLQRIKEKTGAKTNTDAVKNAIRLLEWYLVQKDEGGKVQVEYPDGTVKEIEFVF